MVDMILCRYCDLSDSFGNCNLGIVDVDVCCDYFSIDDANLKDLVVKVKQVLGVDALNDDLFRKFVDALNKECGVELVMVDYEKPNDPCGSGKYCNHEDDFIEENDFIEEYMDLYSELCDLDSDELTKLLLELPMNLSLPAINGYFEFIKTSQEKLL